MTESCTANLRPTIDGRLHSATEAEQGAADADTAKCNELGHAMTRTPERQLRDLGNRERLGGRRTPTL